MQDQGRDILIMELLTGGTLQSRMGQLFQVWDLKRY